MNFVDYMYLAFMWARTLRAERRRWIRFDNMGGNDTPTPRIFYGHDRLAGPKEHVFGGFVKFHDLDRVFPNCPENANILYLVSSALPYFSVRMVKLAKAAGVKVVLNQNGVAYPAWYGPGWKRYNATTKKLHCLADHIVYQSNFCKVSADSFVGDICPSSEILYNPVDTTVFCPPVTMADSSTIQILLAGSHWSYYRPETAIQALGRLARKIPHVSLTIAGRFCWEKDEKVAIQQVHQCAQREGVADKVNYIGAYSQHQAVELFHSSHILLHTKYNDPCPRLVVEAMASGLPVVYSATGGVEELVGNTAGVGVAGPLDWNKDHPPDPELLSQGLLRVINDLGQYREAARTRVEELFDVQPWIERHREIFNNLLGE